MKYDVCVLGGCSLDQMFYEKITKEYDKEPSLQVPGGKGANQAVASSRAGARTVIISKVGDDKIGKFIVENLQKNGVDISCVEKIKGLQNDVSNVYINLYDKDNTIKRKNGAIDSFTPDIVDKYKDVILNSNIVVCQLKVPKNVTEKLINFCYKNNKFLILTPCRPQKLALTDKKNKTLIDKISIITCNREECATIFGTDDVEKCVKKYPNKLIVTLGADGLMYHNGDKIVKHSAIKTDVLDTVGAGDTFCGNLAAMLSQKVNFYQAIRKSMYASAIKIGVKTAQAGMPYAKNLEKFIFAKRNKNFEYEKELKFAIKIIKDAYFNSKNIHNFTITTKPNNTLVTDADLEIESYLINKIKAKFAKDNFLTEESNSKNKLKNRTWIIDPIDGTNHFVKQDGFWGIQMAFYDKGETQLSVIYMPVQNELFYAAKNRGAYINNNKIVPQTPSPLNQCIVDFSGSVFKKLDAKRVLFNRLVADNKYKVANIRHINSCCFSFTTLARGKTDALISSTDSPWDVMPGMFLLKEIGIMPMHLDFESDGLEIFTGNEEVKKVLLGLDK